MRMKENDYTILPIKRTATKAILYSVSVLAVFSFVANIALAVTVINFCHKNRFSHDGITAIYNELDAIHDNLKSINTKFMRPNFHIPNYHDKLDEIESKLESIDTSILLMNK